MAVEIARDDGRELRRLNVLVENGDNSAFGAIARLNYALVIPYLMYYADPDRSSQAVCDAARNALKDVHGFGAEYSKRLADCTAKNGVDTKAFEILSAIGNLEAMEVAAPYLFDFTKTPIEGDIGPRWNAWEASCAFSQMNLRDAPTKPFNGSLRSVDDIVAWQMWAIKHGLVPKEWSSRVGLDVELASIRQLESNVTVGGDNALIGSERAASTPALTPRLVQPLTLAVPAVDSPRRARNAAWLVRALFGLAAGIVSIFWYRRWRRGGGESVNQRR